jgi:dipeptidyl aminopeptidase/acylaminoacyl peptidase
VDVRRALSLALALIACLAPLIARAGRALEPQDWYRFQDVSDLEIAPDGAAVAYLVTSYDRASDESVSALWVADWSGKSPVQLTRGESVSEPRFSPDGRYLSYLTARPAGTPTQLWILDRSRGTARQLSHCDGEISGYAWSPDAHRVVVAMRAAEDPRRMKPIVVDTFQFKGTDSSYVITQTNSHLYLLEIGRGTCAPITSDRQRSDSGPAFSPDGRQIAYVSNANDSAQQAANDEIFLLSAATGQTPRRLTSSWSDELQRLAWSPDGKLIAFMHGDDPKHDVGMHRLALLEVATGHVRELSASLDRTVVSPRFSTDGRSMLLAVEDDGFQYPAQISLDTGRLTRLAGPTVVSELATAAGHTAVLASSDSSPFEVFALEAGRLRPLSAHNQALFAELSLGPVADIAFTSRDGTEIHGQIVRPPGFVVGRRYPTILWIHGGPDGQDDHSLTLESYGPQLERQLFATHGYVVLAINYRGSTGRGADFAHAITADWGHKEVEDLLAGVDYAIAQGIADPARLGVGGWSYGAQLTDYLIASDTRFRAAIAGAGIANQLATYGCDPWPVSENAELGPPWQNTALWLKISYPFVHADRIHTPTLFLHGDKDFKVPISGSEQMYQALRTLGVPTELIVYPGEIHYLTRPSFMVDFYTRYLAWMAQYLGGAH